MPFYPTVVIMGTLDTKSAEINYQFDSHHMLLLAFNAALSSLVL